MSEPAKMIVNDVYMPVFYSKATIIDLWGGRAGGRSYFLSQYILFKLMGEDKFRCALMRNSFQDIKKSLWQEVLDRISEYQIDPSLFHINNNTLHLTYLPNKNNLFGHGFKVSSSNATAKQKSLAGITHGVIDEADEVQKLDFDKLMDTVTRTKKIALPQIIRAFNPPSRNHWIIKTYYNLLPSDWDGYFLATPKKIEGFHSIHATYKDNATNLQAKYIRDREEIGNPKSPLYDKEYYCVNVLGLIPDGRYGQIYKNWIPITLEQFDAMKNATTFYGMDFGFTEDPDTIVKMKILGSHLYVHEMYYSKGKSPQELHLKMMELGLGINDTIVCDNEPRLFASLKKDWRITLSNGQQKILRGFRGLRKQKKPAGSVLAGIKLLQGMKVFYTETSLNLIEEYQNYCWKTDAQHQVQGDPIDKYNHLLDPMRAAVYTLYGRSKKFVKKH